MKRRVSILAALAALALSGAAMAQDIPGTSAAYSACMGRAQSTLDMVTCMNAEMAVQDQALNANYKSALAALPPDQQAKLRKAQRLWLDFRKADCDVFYGKETGTFASIAAGMCMLRHTARRAEDLKGIAEAV